MSLQHGSLGFIPSGLHRTWGTWLEPPLLLCKPAVDFLAQAFLALAGVTDKSVIGCRR